MASDSIITTVGLSKIVGAAPLDQLNITHIAVGDGNGTFTTLIPSMTSLVNEVWRGICSPARRDTNDTSIVIFEAVIPKTVGGFTVREAAIFDNDGDMIAIGHTSAKLKPAPADSPNVTMTVRMRVQATNSGQVVDGGGGVDVTINETPPDNPVAGARWLRCTDMKIFIWYVDVDGGQWVEERGTHSRPNYEITTVTTNANTYTVTGDNHSQFIEFNTNDDIVVTVGKSLTSEGQIMNSIVFVQNTGTGTCTVVADTANGVDLTTNTSNILDGVNATVALIAKSETSWALMGNLEVV